MKLKHLGMFMAIGLLASCANDNLEGPDVPQQAEVDAVYFTAAISYPGTRSTTGESDVTKEDGQTSENMIYNAVLVFANSSNQVVASSEVLNITGGYEATTSPLVRTFKVSDRSSIAAIKNLASNGTLYVVCNYNPSYTSNAALQQTISLTTGGNALTGPVPTTYWSSTTGLLMSSSAATSLSSVDLSNVSNDATKPTDLGKASVQRAMARFDVNTTNPTSNTVGDVTVTFDAVSMVNVSNQFYLYKQVDNQILGTEGATSVVNDPNNSDKEGLNNTDKLFFNVVNGTTATPVSLTYTPYTTLSSKTKVGDYYIWDYCTESTIADPTKQLNGNSTGVVFRAVLGESSTGKIPGFSTGATLWAYNNVMYGNAAAVYAAASNPGSDAAKQLLRDHLLSKSIDLSADKNVTDAALANTDLVGYSKDTQDNKYYAYYYYWNRHNDNTKPNEMGVMEFAVVRNNIYKLAVTHVTGLGLPGDVPPTPSTKDEPDPDTNAYFQVSVEVVQWDVRTNNIEF